MVTLVVDLMAAAILVGMGGAIRRPGRRPLWLLLAILAFLIPAQLSRTLVIPLLVEIASLDLDLAFLASIFVGLAIGYLCFWGFTKYVATPRSTS